MEIKINEDYKSISTSTWQKSFNSKIEEILVFDWIVVLRFWPEENEGYARNVVALSMKDGNMIWQAPGLEDPTMPLTYYMEIIKTKDGKLAMSNTASWLIYVDIVTGEILRKVEIR